MKNRFALLNCVVCTFVSTCLRTSSRSFHRKPLRNIACSLTIVVTICDADFALAINDYDAFLSFVRLWVPELPPSKQKLSIQKQEEFKNVWTQVGLAGENCESAWENALQNDPLMRCALKAYDRFGELEIQYNDLRNQLRSEYGKKQFREMEAKRNSWLRTQENEWIDLEDHDMIRLAVWVLSYGGNQSWLYQKPFAQTAKEVMRNKEGPFLKFVRNAIRNKGHQLNTEEMLSQLLTNQYGALSEADKQEIYQRGVLWMRQQNHSKKEKTDLPDLMQQYLKVRTEAEYLFEIGETYLRMTPQPKVELAKQELTNLLKKAHAIRPDLIDVLIEVHKN